MNSSSIDRLIPQLSRCFRKIESERQQSYPKTLSPSQLNILQSIEQLNPITLKSLASIKKISLATLCKCVDELQKQGLIIRAQSKNDARKKWIVPTQKGIKIQKMNTLQNEAFWSKKLKSLSILQKEEVHQGLLLLLKQLETS
jgi:DNA-binding MarR family transcriptional regulator